LSRSTHIKIWLPALLVAILLTGSAVWSGTVRSKIARASVDRQERLELVATALRDRATCVQLHAKRTMNGSSPFFLLVPNEQRAGTLDTITQYTGRTAMRDTLLHMPLIPLGQPAIVDMTLRFEFVSPEALAKARNEGLLAGGAPGQGGQEAEVWTWLDTAYISEQIRTHMHTTLFTEVEFALYDTLQRSTVFASPPCDTNELFEEGNMVPLFTSEHPGPPVVLVARYPGAAMIVARSELPILLLFVALLGGLAFVVRQSLRAMQAKNKLAQMQMDLVSNITHEFNTPIANIALALETLKKAPTMGSRLSNDRIWDIVHVENKRLHANIKKVLDVSMLEGGQLVLEREHHDVNAILSGATNTFELALTRQHGELTKRLNAQHSWASVDHTYLGNVFQCVLDNAVKYGGEGVHIALTTEDLDGGVMIEVRDNGPGIPSEDRELVFEKFYRVRSTDRYSVKGTGIGLFYARRVVEAHGGWVRIAKPISRGTTLRMFIPHEPHSDAKARVDRRG
jgi:signal transduction histidine kinase